MKHVMIAAALMMAAPAFAAEPTVKEQAVEAGKDMKKGAKKGWNKVKDETCTLVNGKMECAAKKMKHGAENVGNEIKDKVDEPSSN